MINVKLFGVVLITLHLIFAAPVEQCGVKQKLYYLSADKANYFQAFINCKSGGMELASVENVNESDALDVYLAPYKQEGYENAFWLSGTNLNNPTSKQYYWLSTGRPAFFTKWLLTEPDNYLGVQHCMCWAVQQGKTGWCDNTCDIPYRYVCQYES